MLHNHYNKAIVCYFWMFSLWENMELGSMSFESFPTAQKIVFSFHIGLRRSSFFMYGNYGIHWNNNFVFLFFLSTIKSFFRHIIVNKYIKTKNRWWDCCWRMNVSILQLSILFSFVVFLLGRPLLFLRDLCHFCHVSYARITFYILMLSPAGPQTWTESWTRVELFVTRIHEPVTQVDLTGLLTPSGVVRNIHIDYILLSSCWSCLLTKVLLLEA